MSVYEEMYTVAQAWVSRQDRAKLALEGVVTQFIEWCEIPPGQVRFLRWDETKKLYTAKPDDFFSLSQACHFDNEKDEWGVGVSVSLAPPGETGSHARVAFTVRVKANEFDHTVTFGELKPQELRMDSPGWVDALFTSAIESLKKSFVTPSAKSEIGFIIALANEQE